MFRRTIGFSVLGLVGCAALLVVGAFLAGGGRNPRKEIPPPAGGPVDFLRDVRPILASRCFECHGPEKQKGDLRLDRREEALRGGASGQVIVPGRALESRLLRLVAGLEEGKLMPPKGPGLDAGAIGIIRAWIDRGAPWPLEPPPE